MVRFRASPKTVAIGTRIFFAAVLSDLFGWELSKDATDHSEGVGGNAGASRAFDKAPWKGDAPRCTCSGCDPFSKNNQQSALGIQPFRTVRESTELKLAER